MLKVHLAIFRAIASILNFKGIYHSMDDKLIWALCPWFEESGVNVIHPDDLDRMRELDPYGIVFIVLEKKMSIRQFLLVTILFAYVQNFCL